MNQNGEERIEKLERLFSSNGVGVNREIFSTETLLDILIVLYDECNTTLMKREKHILDFLNIGKINIYIMFVITYILHMHWL